ncbi:site-specific DNA-methyltransferase [Thalassococcus profundi]|uniref:site-specific DNA-methyltransferase (adenine-specific) n=1 Tax=Thalassococcus profundi TaxID=2282382 RepID=A0A369TIH4_9RHOB|nr:DNA methyltransferase [Thalassococcus profundi]RDD65040.1 site-specific DNA-methyltransferase [Thalassococcus profundi]
MKNAFYFGDNLHILREYIPDESVDLIYLDPPFNSNANYNLLFKSPDKSKWADSQIATFDDTWSWGDAAEETFEDVLAMPGKAADVLSSLRLILGTNDMLAYLTMMIARLLELHRALKPSGSLYLHCDPTASHYLKIVLDSIFGPGQFGSEICWKRSSAHNDTAQGLKNFGHVHDTLLYYRKSRKWVWNAQFTPYSEEYTGRDYKLIDETGRRFRRGDLTAAKDGGDVSYDWRVKKPVAARVRWTADTDDEWLNPKRGWEYKAVQPYSGRFWAYSLTNMKIMAHEGRIRHTYDGMPEYKRFLDEMPGVPLQDLWSDISFQKGDKRLGYPTQKPITLLQRILETSSNPGDVVLDPFCGCGTTLHAAEELGRKWIGIDVAVQSMHVVQDRLKHHFPNVKYDVFGIPKSADGAMWLAENHPFKFEEWAVTALGAMHSGKFRGDGGIDGTFYYLTASDDRSRGIVSVKGGRSLNPGMVRDLGGTVQTQRRLTKDDKAIGVLVCAHEPTKGMRDAAREFGKVDTLFGPIPAVQIITIAEMFAGAVINVPAMLDTVTAAAIGRKKSARAAFKNPRDLAQREMLLAIAGGKAQELTAELPEDVPVMPSFRERRAAG